MEFKVTFANGRQTYVDADNEKELKSELDKLVKTFGSDVSKVSAMDEKFSVGGFITGSVIGGVLASLFGVEKKNLKRDRKFVNKGQGHEKSYSKGTGRTGYKGNQKFKTGGQTEQLFHITAFDKNLGKRRQVFAPYDREFIEKIYDKQFAKPDAEITWLSDFKVEPFVEEKTKKVNKKGVEVEFKYSKEVSSTKLAQNGFPFNINFDQDDFSTILFNYDGLTKDQMMSAFKKAVGKAEFDKNFQGFVENKFSKGGKISKQSDGSYTHPSGYKIEPYDKGRYILLDPDGMDAVGESMTLSEAKQTLLDNVESGYFKKGGKTPIQFKGYTINYINGEYRADTYAGEQFSNKNLAKLKSQITQHLISEVKKQRPPLSKRSGGGKYGNGGNIEKITEKDFIAKKEIKRGNTLIKLEKLSNPTYYRVTYFDLMENEIISSYGSPNFQDVIFDIKETKYGDGGKTEDAFNPRSFTIDELYQFLKQGHSETSKGLYPFEDISIRTLRKGHYATTPYKDWEILVDGSLSFKRQKWANKKLTISDYGDLHFTKGDENLYLDLIVYAEDGDEELTLSMYTKENHQGLKDFSKMLIQKFKNGGGVGKYEYKTINTRSASGLKEAEKLKAEGWKIISTGFDTIQFERLKSTKKMSTGGSAGSNTSDMNYNEILAVLQEKLDDAVQELPNDYEQSYDAKGEEVEHQSRDGFIAFTDGGYEVTWFEYMSMFHGAGRSLPTKNLDQEMQRQIDYNYQIAKERFVEEYPEIVEELGEDNIDYHSLYEAGYDSEAEKLSEWEMDFDGNDTIMCQIGAYYYTPQNHRSLDGQHTIRLFGLVNLEAPYHRRGNLDDSHDIDITFNSIEELKEKVDAGLIEILNWFGGMYYESSDREMKIRKMANGGDVPKANLGMFLLASQMMQNRQARQSDPNYRSRWEDRGLDYRKQQPMMYPQQPMQPMGQPMGQPMYARGGSVGSDITFKHWSGETKTGTIVEIFPDGSMDVACGFGHCLVNQSDVVGAEKMARGSKVSEYYGIKENNVITEKQMNLIKNRLNAGKKDAELEDIVQYIWDNAPDLTPDQNKKGHEFLMSQWKSPTGKERVNNPFGSREEEALEQFDHFSLAGFHDASRYGQAPYYIPLYDVWMKDGEYGFQYYYNGEVNIVGSKGMKVPSKEYRNNLSRMSKSELLDYCKKNNIPCASGWDKDQILDIIDDVHASRYGKGGSTGWKRDRMFVDKGSKHEVRYARSHAGRTGYKSNQEFGKGGSIPEPTLKELMRSHQFVFEKDDVNIVRIYLEHRVYHVSGFIDGKHFWESFETLAPAKKFYYEQAKKMSSTEAFGTGGGVRTNSKEVREKVRQHILDSVYDYEENQFDNFHDASQHLTDEFKRVADHPSNLKRFPNNQKRFQDYLQGIPFNFEFEEYKIEEFLNSLGINPTGKEYTSDQMWHLYSYLIWREVEPTYRSSKFGGGGTTSDYTLDQDIEFTTTEEDDYLSGNVGGDALDLIDVTHVGNNTNGSAYYTATARSYSVAFEDLSGQELEDELYNTINEMFSTNDQIDVELQSVRLKFGKGGSTGWKRDRMFVDKGSKHEVRYARSHAGRSGYKDAKYGTGGGVRKAPFKVGDMVYSYQNPNHKMRVSFVEDRGVIDGVDYGWGIKVALKTDAEGNYDPKGTYSQSSKWMSANSVSKTKKEKYETGGSTGSKFYVVDNRELTFKSSKPVVASFDTREEARADAKERNKIYDADTKMFSVMTTKQLKAEGVTEFGKGGSAGSGKEPYSKSFFSKTDWQKITDFLNKKYSATETDQILNSRLMRMTGGDNYASFVKFYNQYEKEFVKVAKEKFGKGGSAGSPRGFKSSNLHYNGHGIDANGNKVIRVSFPNSRAFSIQTNGNLPKTHAMSKGGYDEKEINQYVKEYGSDAQKKKLKIY